MPEEGSASLLVVGVIAALVAVTSGFLVVGSAVVASHRARAAADLAALAGADLAVTGLAPSVVCSSAGVIATGNGAALASCVVTVGPGGEVVVEVLVTVDPTLWPAPARARARAGG